jgi:nitrite reductase/ring-hydroxylating ferredoxin subunit
MSDGARRSLKVLVEDASALELGKARVFRFRRGRLALEGFVLRASGGLVAFVNECPHWHVDLDLGDGEFWDDSAGKILCKNHGALFDAETGVCELGPCVGLALERLEFEQEGDRVWVEVPNAESSEPR